MMLAVTGWMVVGALGTHGIYGLSSVGVVLLVVAIALGAAIHRNRPVGDAVLPLIALGGATALLIFGLTTTTYQPCSEAGLIATDENPVAHCGGPNRLISFLPAGGLGLLALTSGGRFLTRRRSETTPTAWLPPHA
jgi:hypothetical protein